jgi:DNA-binding winged helix-turn-helix (wHTH) protein
MRGRWSRSGLPIRSQTDQTGDSPHFRLLGTVQTWRGGEELDLGGPLQRALLASLLLHVGRVVSREQLIDALWDVDPPPRAARSLETKVSRLRATLGESATVLARGGGYVLDASIDKIDVLRFEGAVTEAKELLPGDPRAARSRLQAGLGLWRGEALGGLPEGVLVSGRAGPARGRAPPGSRGADRCGSRAR